MELKYGRSSSSKFAHRIFVLTWHGYYRMIESAGQRLRAIRSCMRASSPTNQSRFTRFRSINATAVFHDFHSSIRMDIDSNWTDRSRSRLLLPQRVSGSSTKFRFEKRTISGHFDTQFRRYFRSGDGATALSFPREFRVLEIVRER